MPQPTPSIEHEPAAGNPQSPQAGQPVDADSVSHNSERAAATVHPAKEVGGRGGLEPTRYGDWEKNGRCIDF